MASEKGRRAPWRSISEFLLYTNRTIEPDYSLKWSLPIKTQRIRGPSISHLSLTMATSPVFYPKKRSTPASSENWQTHHYQSSESLWLSVKRISTMLKNSRKDHMIRMQNLGAMLNAITFGWTINISIPSGIANLRFSFSDRFWYKTQLKIKPISLSYERNGELTMFFAYFCWNKILLRKDG